MRSGKRSCVLVCAALAIPVLMCAQVHHYEYAFPPNHVIVYDVDNGFALVKSVALPFSTGALGSVASVATGMLYLSYGSSSTSGGSLLKYNLVNDQVVWNRTYPFGIDNMSISPDGKTIYMPTGEYNPGGLWEVIETGSGNVIGSIDSGGIGPHNTVITPDGRHVYMAGIGYPYLVEADAATHQILKRIGPVTGGPGVRPFTINGSETLAFMTVAGDIGFQVGDIATGNILYTVTVDGFSCNCGSNVPSHGISISPDEKELYLRDRPYNYVHVFDISGLPGSPPTKVADIPAAPSTGDGWLHHSRDGHYVFVGESGDVIDTTTRTTVTRLPALEQTARSIEIDFQNGVPVWAMENRSSLGTVTGPPANVDTLTFHSDRQRTGWQPSETILTPQVVGSANFGPIWNSPQFDKSGNLPPHAYASPLYVDRVTMSGGPYAGQTFSVVLAATSNDFVYAVNASFGSPQVPAGTILWSRSLGTPGGNTNTDLIPLGILGTPTVDTSVTPPRLYVVAVDQAAGHQAFALDITNGNTLPGWPLAINNNSVSSINQNGLATFQPADLVSQRGGLNLSPDGKTLYVTFGGYVDSAPGWLVAIDTQLPALVSAFAGAPSTGPSADAGMWAASGVAIDNTGNVFSTTGNGSVSHETTPGYWGNSLLAWSPGVPLSLQGTYTPFNYCLMDSNDTDLGGGGAMLVPGLTATGTSTPNLVAFGGKQGNIYLVDRDHLPGGLSARLGCGTDASLDLSLLPPGIQPQFGTRGPLNVFGPYSETSNDHDTGKARSTPAFWTGPDGTPYLLVTGSNKATMGSSASVPPGVYRLKIVAQPGQPAYLQVDAFENTLTFNTPGSPVITSNGSTNAIVWVLEANVPRSQALNSATPSQPFLVAMDAVTLQKLYQSNPGELFVGGKYNTPVIARGTVFVATDRIQAFGLKQVVPTQSVPVISSFTANPASIVSGKSATLSWATTGTVTGLSIDQGIGTVTGSSKSVSPTTTTTYTLTASNSGGPATKTATVTVTPLPPPVISAFTANPVSVVSGKSATLSWATTGTVASLSIDQGVGTVTGTSRSVSPTTTTTYTLTASNNGGPATKTVTVTVTPLPAPVITSFTANPTSIVSGKSATLAWVATGTVTSLSIDQGVGAVTGTSKSVSPTTTTTYTLTASNAGGSATKTFTVTVTPPPAPVITSFTANPASIVSGQSATLLWATTGTVTSLSIDQGVGTVTGTSKSVSPTTSTTYTLTAGNSGSSVTKTFTLTVTPPPAPMITSFTANPASIVSGQSVTLSWATTGTVTSLSIDQGFGTVIGTSKSVSPISTTTYTLTANNNSGSATKTVTVTVTPPPPPPLPAINSFSASPTLITAAQSSTLAWGLTGTVTSLNIDQGIGSVAGLTSKSVSPATNTTYTLTATNLNGSVTKSVTVQVAPLPVAVVPFAMNACGPNVANFVAEVAAYTAGGNCTNIGSPSVVTTGVANAAPPGVYQTKRTGQNGVGFTYTIQLPAPPVLGQLYTVRLHFADDLSTAAGQRVFNVAISGNVVLPNLDIFALTGQKMRALVKDVLDIAPNTKNQIVVQGLYTKSGQNPVINGVEIIPQPNGIYSPGSNTLFYLPLDGPTPIAPEACIVGGGPALALIADRFGKASSAIHVGATGSPFDSFQIQCSNTKIASSANLSFTVGYWIRMSQLPNNGDCSVGCGYRTLTILSTNSDNGGCRKYLVTEIENGGVPDGCQGGTNGNNGQFLSTRSIVDSKWHNLLWVFDNSNKVLTLYIDGIQNGTAPLPDPPFSPSNTQYLAGAENGSFALNGDLDDFWIESHAWTPAEVSAFLRQAAQ